MDTRAPTRQEIEEKWVALIEGSLTREEVHAWARPWVEGSSKIGDPLVSLGATHLHGFDMTYDPAIGKHRLLHGWRDGREYLRPMDQVRADLEDWRFERASFDRDPVAWRGRRTALAKAAIREERSRRSREGGERREQ